MPVSLGLAQGQSGTNGFTPRPLRARLLRKCPPKRHIARLSGRSHSVSDRTGPDGSQAMVYALTHEHTHAYIRHGQGNASQHKQMHTHTRTCTRTRTRARAHTQRCTETPKCAGRTHTTPSELTTKLPQPCLGCRPCLVSNHQDLHQPSSTGSRGATGPTGAAAGTAGVAGVVGRCGRRAGPEGQIASAPRLARSRLSRRHRRSGLGRAEGGSGRHRLASASAPAVGLAAETNRQGLDKAAAYKLFLVAVVRNETLLKRDGHQKGRLHREGNPYSPPPLLAPCRSEGGRRRTQLRTRMCA